MRDIQTIDQVHILPGDRWRGLDWWSDEKLQTIDQVHILSGDRWRGWDGMIRWEIFKQLAKFTYELEADEEDGMSKWEIFKQFTKFTYFLETDDQMRDIQTIHQVHLQAGDGWRRWDGMISWEIFKKLSKFTYFLEMDKRMGWDDQMRDIQTIDQVHVLPGGRQRGWDGMIRREIFKQLAKFTYILEMDEEDHIGLTDERYSKNWPSSHTLWRWMKRTGWDDQMRDIQTIEQVHKLPGDGWRGWDVMITWEIFKQLTKFTYSLETDEEDRMGWSDVRYSNNWPSSHTSWRQMKRMGWDDQMRDIQTIDQVHILPGEGWRGWDKGLQLTSSNTSSWRTLWASTMEIFRNSTILLSFGVSQTLIISLLERNCFSHRRLQSPRFNNRKLFNSNSYQRNHPSSAITPRSVL